MSDQLELFKTNLQAFQTEADVQVKLMTAVADVAHKNMETLKLRIAAEKDIVQLSFLRRSYQQYSLEMNRLNSKIHAAGSYQRAVAVHAKDLGRLLYGTKLPPVCITCGYGALSWFIGQYPGVCAASFAKPLDKPFSEAMNLGQLIDHLRTDRVVPKLGSVEWTGLATVISDLAAAAGAEVARVEEQMQKLTQGVYANMSPLEVLKRCSGGE